LSSSKGDDGKGGEFERWIVEQYAATNGFTALILLINIGSDKVELISCSYVHVIGDEVRWKDMKTMLDASRRKWDAFAIFAESPPGGGPLIDLVAKARLQERIDEVTVNRMVLNDAGFFDTRGRHIRIDPVGLH
jgi:hypothetical protein